MSDDAIQDLLDEMDAIAAGDKVSHWTITRARGQHEAHRARVAELTSALEGRAVEVAELKATIEALRLEAQAHRRDADIYQKEWRATVADLSRQYADVPAAYRRAEQAEAKARNSEEIAELRKRVILDYEAYIARETCSLKELQEAEAKVARLESAIADQVIADGVARGG